MSAFYTFADRVLPTPFAPATPAKMKVTSSTKTKIIRALSKKGWNMSDLAEKLGKHRTWSNKILGKNATITELSDETVDRICDLLGISLNPIQTVAGRVSTTAIDLSKKAESDPRIAGMLEAILEMADEAGQAYIPVVETKELQRIGSEITKIVHRLEQPKGDYSPKIASEVLAYLREYFAK